MEDIKRLMELLEATRILAITHALFLIVIGYFCAKTISATISKLTDKKMTAHGKLILKRAMFYGIFGLFCISALRQLGFDLSVVLGAAGIFTVALGFASQTSASNLISGLFLMIERPFSISDVIRVNSVTGEVISIDLLSVKEGRLANVIFWTNVP